MLQLLVGDGDGYGLVRRSFQELGGDLPHVLGWGSEIGRTVDGMPVTMAFRTTPSDFGTSMSLMDHLNEVCLRFAVPGFEPEADWTYLDVIKKARNKFGSHADPKPPRWLKELRYYPAGDSNVATLILWRTGEIILAAVTAALAECGVDVNVFQPADRYLGGIDLSQAIVGAASGKLDVRIEIAVAELTSGRRRPIVAALHGDRAFLVGLDSNGGWSTTQGLPGESVGDLAENFRIAGLPNVGRNTICPCGSGRKYKRCHGRGR